MHPPLTEPGGPSDIELRHFLSSFPFSPVWSSLPYMQIHAGRNGHLLPREVISMKFLELAKIYIYIYIYENEKENSLNHLTDDRKTVRINL